MTLIELMVVVAVVALLASVAVPSYTEHLRKSHRAEAQAHLMALAARQQQFLLDTRGFAASLTAIGLTAPPKVSAHYTLTMDVAGGPPPTFTITATPSGGQTAEGCGTLSINQAGVKTAAKTGCW